ncbi:hypothetical protein EVAR_61604_1 [Eumeta japonica]|uniref:Uncharacterized protein n=1 Tax=Eumeta variegata TaxID=151549 RepID=A0A4C1SGW3_EUMVA|nr:hypothetical protein EVAR_61604_1 [Eumeta japonica]
MFGTRMKTGRVGIARSAIDTHRIRVRNRSPVEATVTRCAYRPGLYLCMLSTRQDYSHTPLKNVKQTSLTSGSQSTTETDAPTLLQFINGVSACTYELHTLYSRRRGHALCVTQHCP